MVRRSAITFTCAISPVRMYWRSSICSTTATPSLSISGAVTAPRSGRLIEMVRSVTGREFLVRDAPQRPGDPSELVADAKKAREVVGWAPERSDLTTIIADAWRWHSRRFGCTYTAHGFHWGRLSESTALN